MIETGIIGNLALLKNSFLKPSIALSSYAFEKFHYPYLRLPVFVIILVRVFVFANGQFHFSFDIIRDKNKTVKKLLRFALIFLIRDHKIPDI